MAERRMLIDWVNSIDMPSCLLVSTVEDLRDGIALCDIYSYLQGISPLQSVQRGGGSIRSRSLHNLGLLLKQFKIPGATVERLFNDDESLYGVLKQLANMFEPEVLLENRVKPTSTPPSEKQKRRSPKLAQTKRPASFNGPKSQTQPSVKTPRRQDFQFQNSPLKSNTPRRPSGPYDNPAAEMENRQPQPLRRRVEEQKPIRTQWMPRESNNEPPLVERQQLTEDVDATPRIERQIPNFEEDTQPRIIQRQTSRKDILYSNRNSNAPIRREIQTHQSLQQLSPMPISQEGTPMLQMADETTPQKVPKQAREEFPPISEQVKEKFVSWVEDLNIIRRNSIDTKQFPAIVRSGVFLWDLINRVEGKNEIIKGIHRKPKNNTAALTNINKALDYLKKFPKMNGRFIFFPEKILEENENVIWGLLDDIWTLFNNAQGRNKNKSPQAKTPRSMPPTTVRPEPSDLEPTSSIDMHTSASVDLPPKIIKRENPRPMPAQTLRKTPLPQFTISPTPSSRSYTKRSYSARPRTVNDTEFTNRSVLSTFTEEQQFFEEDGVELDELTPDIIFSTKEWLRGLGFESMLNSGNVSLLQDPVRNGVLLCKLVSLLENTRFLRVHGQPSNMNNAKENIEKALTLLRDRRSGVPTRLLRQSEKILQGDNEAIWGLMWCLMKAYPHVVQDARPKYKCELPYSDFELSKLEESLNGWLNSIGVVKTDFFSQVIADVKTGVLLCELVDCIFGCRIRGVFKAPKTQSTCASNIRKALEMMRRSKRMSQKFLWREREISLGDHGSILGLLEDVHRYANRLPARKSGPNYFKDGPYVNKSQLNRSYAMMTPTRSVASPTWSSTREPGTPQWNKSNHGTPGSHMKNEMPSYLLADTTQSQSISLTPVKVKTTPQVSTTSSTLMSPKASSQASVAPTTLNKWLEDLALPCDIDFYELQIEEFRSGIFYIAIIEKLEGNELRGVHRNPKSNAAALQNIRKVLEFLKTRKKVPSRLFFAEDALLRGDSEVVRDLLGVIQAAYKTRSKTFSKFKNRSFLSKTSSNRSLHH